MLRQQLAADCRIHARRIPHVRIFWTLAGLLIGTVSLAVLPDRAGAAPKTWKGPDTGNWSAAGNWNPTGVPINADDVTISVDNPVTFNASLAMDATNLSASGLNSMTLNSTGISGTFTINQTSPTSAMIANTETIGSTIVSNVYNQTAGTNTIGSGGLTLGSGSGSNGTYQLSGSGILNVTGTEFIGYSGVTTSLFSHSAGTNSIGGNLNIGVNVLSHGEYDLSGTGAVSLTTPGAIEYIGALGGGTFNQTGGTNSAPFIQIANGASTDTGSYVLSGGSATASNYVYVGGGGTGTLTVFGTGVLNVGNNLVAYNTGSSVIYLNGGRINAGGVILVVPSLLNWTSGTLNLTRDTTFDSSFSSSTANPFGPSLMLGNNQTLIITGSETLGGAGPFSLTLNSGSSHYVTGSITLSPTGTITQNAGSSLYYSSFTQAGGTVNGTLQNQGTFTYQSGLFNGRLLNQGTANLGPSFTAGNGVENDATIALTVGQTLTVNGIGLDNIGTMQLSGGTISGSGAALNDYGGTMTGYGTLNAALTNYGILNVNGVLRLNGGVTNYGVIKGSGAIFGAVVNSYGGLIQVAYGSDLSFMNNWGNGGVVNLLGGGAVLGGATIFNATTIEGAGLIGAPITNSGIIRASGGELDLGSAGNTNGVSGQIQAGTGDTVLVVDGLATNAGTIALSGGTFDNNNLPITNATTGYIIGAGAFRSGGLTNNGTVTFADSPTNVFGSVTTTGVGSVVKLVNNTTTFYGPVTIAGNSSFITSNATARFLAGYTGSVTPGLANGGAAEFAGSDAVYGSVSNSGAVTVDNGNTTINGQFTGAGSVANGGTLVFNTSASAPDTIGGTFTNSPSASLVVQGNGSLEIDAAPTLGRVSSIAVSGGSRLKFNVASGAATIGTGVTATVAGGSTLELAGSVSALSSGANRANIVNNSTAPGLLVSGTQQQVGGIDGSGTTQVNAGSDLTANHIVQSALIIGGTASSPALMTIAASDSLGNPLGQSSDQTSALILAGSLDPTGAAAVGPPIAASFSTIGEPSSNDPSGPRSVLGSAGVGESLLLVPEPATWLLLAVGSLACLAPVLSRVRATQAARPQGHASFPNPRPQELDLSLFPPRPKRGS